MNIAIILSGGVGSRMGIDMPKQYVEVEGMPVLGYSLAAFAAHPDIDAIVVAVADQWRDFVAGLAARLCPEKPVSLARPARPGSTPYSMRSRWRHGRPAATPTWSSCTTAHGRSSAPTS